MACQYLKGGFKKDDRVILEEHVTTGQGEMDLN